MLPRSDTSVSHSGINRTVTLSSSLHIPHRENTGENVSIESTPPLSQLFILAGLFFSYVIALIILSVSRLLQRAANRWETHISQILGISHLKESLVRWRRW